MNRKETGIRWLCLSVWMLCLWSGVTGCGKTEVTWTDTEEVIPAEEQSLFAIVTHLDEVNEKITLRAVAYDTEVVLHYNGGVDVRDRFGELLPIGQITPGCIVDAVYDANRDKLLSLYISGTDKVQCLEHVSGVKMDHVQQLIWVNDISYHMGQSLCAFSERAEIGTNEICPEDQVTLWLYNDSVCSVYVELGHGYVRLSDYASYIGGMVEIGYDVIVPVTEDMLLTVREGEYMLRIEKGDDVGMKKVEVLRDQEVNISLADLAVEPKKTGSVLFRVTPADAAVYIDGKRVNTEGAINMVYGKHKIYITADGYDAYSASFQVNYAYKVKEYTLSQTGSTTQESGNQTTTGTEKTGKTTEKTASEDTVAEEQTEETTTEGTDTKDVTATEGTKTNNKVTVSAPVGASVYFDGEFLGIAPISFTKVTGSHIITLSQTGYLSKSYTVTLTDDGQDSDLQYEELISISSLIDSE
ncbi:MAG: PEGA domain-containing protein [Lachnospiraceae bacterium]|nr:PEGA domain-containing protein [Lachnospiraceae bacterium]